MYTTKKNTNSGTTVLQIAVVVCKYTKTMWVSSVTSNHRSATARCSSSRNNDRTTILQYFEGVAWNAALTVCATIILLNTVGLISVVCADTIQYPVTAPIPPGKLKQNEQIYICMIFHHKTHLHIFQKKMVYVLQPLYQI